MRFHEYVSNGMNFLLKQKKNMFSNINRSNLPTWNREQDCYYAKPYLLHKLSLSKAIKTIITVKQSVFATSATAVSAV